MAETVTLNHPGFILGVPGEYPAGIYEIDNGAVVSFTPLPAPTGDDAPVEALGSPTEPLADQTGNQSAETQQATPAQDGGQADTVTGNTLG